MPLKDIVVSGTRSTGFLHLGNYFGAVRQYIAMQEAYECFYFIADYHSLTTHPNPADLHENAKTVLVEYLACGVDPEKCTLYLQSDLPQIAELYLFFNMHAYKGELERVTTFKEKARQNPDNVNAGLLTYPTLMAADILIHKGTKVPVGKDQEQHLEMTRTFARRFNEKHGKEVFPEPEAFNMGHKLIKIPGLDGTGKMGKSEGEGNAIFLREKPEEIRKKVMRAVTDTGPKGPGEPMSDGVKNLFALMEFVSSPDTITYFKEQYNAMAIRYGDMKKQLAEDMILFTTPIRERIEAISKDEAYLKKVVKTGTEKALASADKTLDEVRKVIGFKAF